jgi:hypothetical protein
MFLVALVPDWLVGAQEVLFSVRGADASLQPTDAARTIALPGLRGVAGEGNPEPDVGRESRGGGHDADDGAGDSVELQRATEDVRRCTETLPPERLQDDDHVLGLRPVFLGGEHAPDEWLDAEHGGKVMRHGQPLDSLRAGAVRQVEAVLVVERDVVEQLHAVAPLVEVGVVDSNDVEIPSRRRLVEVHEPIGGGKGKWAQEQPVHEAEDDHVGSDAEREHADDQ